MGNIEPRDVPNGEVDVVVCDGFTGNVILKLTEGVAKMLLGMLKQMFLANLGGKLAYLLLKGGVATSSTRWTARSTAAPLPGGKAAGHQGPRLLQGQGHQERHPAGKDLRGERPVRHHAGALDESAHWKEL